MSGYSGTPLTRKLGLKPGDTIIALNAPAEYAKLVAPFPIGAAKMDAPFVHLFVTSMAALKRDLPKARKVMAQDGMLWVSWHKKAAKIPTDVTEDTIRDLALDGDLVDVKVCAVDARWSGLKLVVRKHLR